MGVNDSVSYFVNLGCCLRSLQPGVGTVAPVLTLPGDAGTLPCLSPHTGMRCRRHPPASGALGGLGRPAVAEPLQPRPLHGPGCSVQVDTGQGGVQLQSPILGEWGSFAGDFGGSASLALGNGATEASTPDRVGGRVQPTLSSF